MLSFRCCTGRARSFSSLAPAERLYLGLDSSTQGLKATAIDSNLKVHASFAINYQKDLPHYSLKNGVHAKADNVVTQPTLMVRSSRRETDERRAVLVGALSPAHLPSRLFSPTYTPPQYLEALDLLFSQMKAKGFPFKRVAALSGSGQQHGSAYWKRGARASLTALRSGSNAPLKTTLANAFSTLDSPIWMDSSTSTQCAALEKALGGAQAVADISGSRAYERFTGNQIAKFAQKNAAAYKDTERISLVSLALSPCAREGESRRRCCRGRARGNGKLTPPPPPPPPAPADLLTHVLRSPRRLRSH